MSVSNPERIVTKQDLADFYDELLPFIAPKAYAGFTPIGTIISIFGESAPANYLICDGATYNVVDYPELCAHLWSLTTNSQYKVSGDATKFKVPDLRGEFLRGAGTNGHTSEGNGANVGVHQDATRHLRNRTANSKFYTCKDSTLIANYDKQETGTGQLYVACQSDTTSTGIEQRYTSRPTNTSVLFCIATKNIYLDPKNDYSTEEKVIGTWIDGKPLYQKTFVDTLPAQPASASYAALFIDIGASVEYGYISSLVVKDATAYIAAMYTTNDASKFVKGYLCSNSHSSTPNKIAINCNNWYEKPVYVTIQYTKTTS